VVCDLMHGRMGDEAVAGSSSMEVSVWRVGFADVVVFVVGGWI